MRRILFVFSFLLIIGGIFPAIVNAQSNQTVPPDHPVKLIFIHHSTGQNWLADGYGDLGRELANNNYFVSDTNYGWGPDSIGDRTDIVNWREWFRSSETPRYMAALFNESAQNAPYTRIFPDPGGENQIVMFKSCFPNSALTGNPNDHPDPSEGLTFGHAKYVYNDLLNYFSSRPDKLFVVITAPPLQDPTHADNARAFNNWLVYDWLAESNYALNNVVVFDFYNVLTHPDNHHRVNGGQIEHINNGVNTLYYDSDGDNHPNIVGSQKATEEYIPLLNYYYHQWVEGAPAVLPDPVDDAETTDNTETEAEPPVPSESEGQSNENTPHPEAPPADILSPGLIDNFDGSPPPGTDSWQPYWDATTTTQFNCALEGGSLRIDFDISTDSWATCTLFFDDLQDWSIYQGVALSYQADAPARIFDITLHSGTLDEPTSYQSTVESVPGCDETWISIDLTWSQILGVDWEADANNPIEPAQITGVSFGFSTYEGASNSGTIWIDDLRLISGETESGTREISSEPEVLEPESAPPESSEEDIQTDNNEILPESEPETPDQESRGLCPNSIALGMLALVGVILKKKQSI